MKTIRKVCARFTSLKEEKEKKRSYANNKKKKVVVSLERSGSCAHPKWGR